MEVVKKDLLLLFPTVHVRIMFPCPKCKSPLVAKKTPMGCYIVCNNPFCDFYSSFEKRKENVENRYEI